MVPEEDNVSTVTHSPSCRLNCSDPPSSYDIDVPKAVTMGLVFALFVAFGVLGNVLVVLSVACNRHLRSVTHYFIANLAVADLLLSSVVLPFSASFEVLGRWVFGRPLCAAWTALDVLCCTASILSLTVISIDRCLAVSYPLRYPTLVTGGRGVGAVVTVWAVSASISVGPLFGWREPMPEDESVCRVNEHPGYAVFSALCSFYLPLAVILVMYCRVYVVARRKTQSLREGRQGGSGGGGAGQDEATLRIHCGNANGGATGKCRSHCALLRLITFSREKKAAKTLGVVVGCFVLCWLPFFLVLPISSIFPSHRPSDTVFKITFWLGYFNSCLNPIIYPCFSQEFKKAFQNVLRGHCFHATSRRWSGPSGAPHHHHHHHHLGCHTALHPHLAQSTCPPTAPPPHPHAPVCSSSSCCGSGNGHPVTAVLTPQSCRTESQGRGSLMEACCISTEGKSTSAAPPPLTKTHQVFLAKREGQAV